MNSKEKKELIKLIKKLNILSWRIEPRKNNSDMIDIELSGLKKG